MDKDVGAICKSADLRARFSTPVRETGPGPKGVVAVVILEDTGYGGANVL
jgi:hypothetical protein